MSLQVSIRQTLVLQLECVVENACELHTVLLAEYGGLACCRLRSFVAAKAPFQDESSSFHSADPIVLQLECVVENACELHTVLLAEHGGLEICRLRALCRCESTIPG